MNKFQISNFKFKNSAKKQVGQALVVLLVFIAMATTIIGGAIAVTIINSQTTSKFALGEEALATAETGVDNAILKLLRTPTYNGSNIPPEILTVGNGTADINISGIPSVTITSIGQINNIIRKVQVEGTYQNNIFTTTRYQEVD